MTGTKRETKWLRPVTPAGAILLLALAVAWLVLASPAAAVDNVVSVQPARILMPPGGTIQLKVMTDPPSQTVAVWVIELAFDPDVVTAESEDCNSIDTPAGAVGASGCEVVDTDGDGKSDTAKLFGAELFTGTEAGLEVPVSLADITFHVVGQGRDCTDFRLRINIHADPDADETGALVQDGRGCVAGDAPPGGTAEPTVVEPRTSEPTPEGGADTPPFNTGGQNTGDGSTDGSQVTPAGTLPTNADGSTQSPRDATEDPEATRTQPGGVVTPPEDDDGGGVSAAVWVLVGVLVLGIAGGGAWAIARTRKPPEA